MESLLPRFYDYQRFAGCDKMILPDFILPSRVNQTWAYNAMDSLQHCFDKKHFKSYPHLIEYKYNSRGFRDTEWPDTIDELKQAVWCVGDSFTVGLGSPVEHTWPYQVGKKLEQRTINVSMDGASNMWIARKVVKLIESVSPELIVIQWSYTNRRESDNTDWTDEERKIHLEKTQIQDDMQNTMMCIESVMEKCTKKIVHSFIPNFSWATDKLQLQDKINRLPILTIPEIVRLDIARDGHHYDIRTAEKFSFAVRDLLTNRLS
jgi:hypothetical protein